jgi:hypothetical protein
LRRSVAFGRRAKSVDAGANVLAPSLPVYRDPAAPRQLEQKIKDARICDSYWKYLKRPSE